MARLFASSTDVWSFGADIHDGQCYRSRVLPPTFKDDCSSPRYDRHVQKTSQLALNDRRIDYVHHDSSRHHVPNTSVLMF